MISQEMIELHKVNFIARLNPFLKPADKDFLTNTKIILSTKLRTSLGRAYFTANKVELNVRLLNQYPDELKLTLAHELAHIAAPLIYGRKGLGHQSGWRHVMEILGESAARTHNLDVGTLKSEHSTVAIAHCQCQGLEHKIKTRRFKMMQRKTHQYICKYCRTILVLTDNTTHF